MGRGRGRAVATGCVLGALALMTAGCGAEENANEPRPQPPTRVSVSITPRTITLQPPRIAIGPEPTQQIPQNQHAGQPRVDSDAPLDGRLRHRQPDRLRLEAGDPRSQGRHLWPARRQRQRLAADLAADRRLPGQRRRHPRRQAGPLHDRLVPHLVAERPAAAVKSGLFAAPLRLPHSSPSVG